ncbi:MAG TPA: outer membrane protein assembly factor BamE [Nordella sp.]|nr:outer membrane protein assembly factor BamE [Nordella sp.]
MRRFLALSSRLLLPAAMALTVAACSSNIAHRGYLAKPGAFGQVREGMAKSEVEGILGSPSTTAGINFQGDSYYYISSTTEQTAFLNPKEVERQVIAVRFDRNDQVASLGQYGLEDGKIVDINSRTTPTKGRELTMLQQIFGNIGKPGPGGSIVPGRAPGSTGPGKSGP